MSFRRRFAKISSAAQRTFAGYSAAIIDYRLLVPLLINSVLFQIVITLARLMTSYRALELHLSVILLGAIAATFALLPVFLAVWVGRFIDRGNDAVAAWIGSGVLAVACCGFVLYPSPIGLVAWTALLGVGQLLMMAAQQMLCVRVASREWLDHVFGNYLVAASIGQALGPLMVGWVGGSAKLPPTKALFVVSLIAAVAAFLIALTIRPKHQTARNSEVRDKVPLKSLLSLPGLNAVIVAGICIITAQDLIIIYFPILGAERTIPVDAISTLLIVRAGFAIASRLVYARFVTAFGHDPLMVCCTFAAALSFAAIAAPMPLWAMYIAMAIMGFALGAAMTLSITMVVARTPANARATANSLRIMGNRIGQVSLPFGASLMAASTGVAGILVLIALSLAASAAAVRLTQPVQVRATA